MTGDDDVVVHGRVEHFGSLSFRSITFFPNTITYQRSATPFFFDKEDSSSWLHKARTVCD